MKIKPAELHPATIKYLNLGHFWVTEESYTKRFPKDADLILGIDSKTKKEVGLFIPDFRHKNVKARFFSKDKNIDVLTEIKKRVDLALLKRVGLNLFSERENVLLINGESDLLPGLLVMCLKNQILIQYYALYWSNFEATVIEALKSSLAQHFPTLAILDYWIQERTFDQKKSIRSINNTTMPEFILKEFDINYKIRINAYYDYGIYTDMSAIRKQIFPFLKNKKKALNLFCYTGAYSLYALKNKVTEVTSVDLSDKYLQWLNENILLNGDLDINHHRSINTSVDKALDKFLADVEQFDFILSDPPSSSSDGDKRENAFSAYEKTLPKLLKLLTKNGSLVVFLNTHQISWNKFEEKLKNIIDQSEFKNQVIIGKRFKLAEDYLPTKGFHEGDYLKGFLIEFKHKENL